VDGGDLNDGAARRDEPVEALALAELGDGTGGRICGTNFRKGFEVSSDQVEVEVWPEGAKALIVDVDAGFEEALLQAEDDNACVEELFALDTRDDANDCVVK
jgi:hypothetical protein